MRRHALFFGGRTRRPVQHLDPVRAGRGERAAVIGVWDPKSFFLWWYKGTSSKYSPVSYFRTIVGWSSINFNEWLLSSNNSAPPPPTPIPPSPSTAAPPRAHLSLAIRLLLRRDRDGAVPDQEPGHLPRPIDILRPYGYLFLSCVIVAFSVLAPCSKKTTWIPCGYKSIDPIYGTVLYGSVHM
jgi:hypothetical protein